MIGKAADLYKEADLLCSDTITNFKTVQSLGNEDMVFRKYRDIVTPILHMAVKTNLLIALAYGCS